MHELQPDFRVMAEGYKLAEAPRDDGAGGFWFSDVLGGGVHHWVDGQITTIAPDRKGIGGMVVHADGGVVISGRSVAHLSADGTDERLLLERPEGITGFNDMCADPEGNVIVGALRFRPFAGEDPVPGELWRITEDGGAVVGGGVVWPNGVGVEAAGTLVLCDYADGRVLRVGAGEAVRSKIVGTSPSGEADGLALDGDGGIWVALGTGGAVARLSPEGEWTHRVEVPATFVSSLAFAGDDGDTLLVTTMATGGETGTVMCCPAPVAGRPHNPARV